MGTFSPPPRFFTLSLSFRSFSLFFLGAAIKTALKQENLNPEIEEKLLQLQRYQEKQMKQEPPAEVVAAVAAPVPRVATPSVLAGAVRLPARKRPPSTSLKNDDEWIMEAPKRSRNNRSGGEVKKDDVW